MSAQVRAELAAAASSVEVIRCRPYYTQDTRVGAAFVRLDRVEFPNRFGGVAHWVVVVVLDQDLAAAEKFIEDQLPALVEALQPVLVVTSALPQRMEFPDAGVLPCVFINGHREA